MEKEFLGDTSQIQMQGWWLSWRRNWLSYGAKYKYTEIMLRW